ncbi:MAG: Cof-type HAD-IIB family hydrolase [Psychromonas sp.]|nr:Cof-type HAD-IIB family hydrolase [Alteromonadales bacterium]MCP5077692.1 Cof-type HAD-IIB family hydrolase [Psychromonas sp.]
MYKVAISDLDGTLLGPDHKISSQTKNSIHNWIESGRKFVIATGRHYIEAKSLQEQLGEPVYLITSNGARVHNKAGKIILKQNLPADIAKEICNLDIDKTIQLNLFTDEHWYANFRLQELDDIAIGEGFTCQATDIKTLDKSNTIKIFFWADRDLLEVVYEVLNSRFGDRINLTFSLDKCLEVMNAGTNKGTAVKEVLKEKGFKREEAIAFGDAMNDVEMLTLVGKPILMKNSQQALRNELAGAETTLSAKEHGVAVKMDHLLA